MSSVEFGVLVDAPLREAWSHEAHGFTPWLAENLDRIGRAVGLPLELDGTEVPVGPYRADLLATNLADSSKVLIENQLEQGDHSHLGQILTYLTGLDAHTVIWVAQDFRAEHLSAIRWLNQHTEDPFAFIAVRLRVVRIGASPYAPLFEVVEQPNGWDRSVQEVKKAVTQVAGENAERRRNFWELYMSQHPEASADTRVGGGTIWRAVPGCNLFVSQWIAKDKVGLFIRGGRGTPVETAVESLSSGIAALEVTLGAPVGNPRWAFGKQRSVEADDSMAWEVAANWLAAETQRYVEAIQTVMGPASAS